MAIVINCAATGQQLKFFSGTPSELVFLKVIAEFGDCIHSITELQSSDGRILYQLQDDVVPDGEYTYNPKPETVPAPSAYDYKQVAKSQSVPDPKVLNFWPTTAIPPLPLQLSCSIFGNFLDNIRDTESALPPATDVDYEHYAQLVSACSSFYEDESLLREELRRIWGSYLCQRLSDEMFTGAANFEGVSRSDLGLREALFDALVLLFELKRGVSTSKTEPLMEVLLNFRLNWFNARVHEKELFSDTLCPALIVQHVGQHLQIGGAILMPNKVPGKQANVCYQPLASVELVPIHRHDMSMSLQGVRTCMAVKAAVQELVALYRESGEASTREGPLSGIQDLYRRCVPEPLVGEAWEMEGVEVMQMGTTQENKLVYSLKKPAGEESCVVKYCQSYGTEVHKAWAAAGFAPKFLSIERLPGGWDEIRMEWLPREDGWKRLFDLKEAEADALRGRVVEVLEKAHRVQVGVTASGETTFGVHGDMRDANVIVKTDGNGQVQVRFIDFDWAAEQTVGTLSSSCYPGFMNHVQINWPNGVAAGKPMLQQHDVQLIKLKQRDQIKKDIKETVQPEQRLATAARLKRRRK